MTGGKILVFNVGSSSCKFQIFDNNLNSLGKGLIDRIGISGTTTEFKTFTGEKFYSNHLIRIEELFDFLVYFFKKNKILSFDEVDLMVHRVVSGSDVFKKETLIDSIELLKKLKEINPLAPLHNPYNYLLLEKFFYKFRNIKQIIVPDTSFHQTLSEVDYLYSIPQKFYKENKIRKYGAHGTSHKFMTYQLEKTLDKNTVNLISLHLGNGSSLCAIKNSKSIDTSMGFTPLAGLTMGTRSGDIDPSVIFYLINNLGWNSKELEQIFLKKSGLLGISSISSDMRDLESVKNKDKNAKLAIDIYVKRVVNYLAQYLNLFDQLDGIVFTAGIGENGFKIIRQIIEQIKVKKLKLKDSFTNKEAINLISTPESEIKIYIIPTNEEYYMAKLGKELILNDL